MSAIEKVNICDESFWIETANNSSEEEESLACSYGVLARTLAKESQVGPGNEQSRLRFQC